MFHLIVTVATAVLSAWRSAVHSRARREVTDEHAAVRRPAHLYVQALMELKPDLNSRFAVPALWIHD